EAFGLETGQDGPDQTAFNGVRLQQNKGAIRHLSRLRAGLPDFPRSGARLGQNAA
ncbi:MAG: hypothetical protein RLY19_206, partial [Actinomycetota bacterium]